MKFKLHAIREYRAPTQDWKEVLSDEKDVIVEAPSCCEAVVQAKKSLQDYVITKWEEVKEKSKKD